MFAILRGANGRRHEVDFKDDPVVVDVSMSSATVQITMTALTRAILPRVASSPLLCHAIRSLPPWPLQPPVRLPTANPDRGSSAMNELWSVMSLSFCGRGVRTPADA